jgi:hypothetical protein
VVPVLRGPALASPDLGDSAIACDVEKAKIQFRLAPRGGNDWQGTRVAQATG